MPFSNWNFKPWTLGVYLGLLAAAPVQANPASQPGLDTLLVHTLFVQGDFGNAIGILETGLQLKRTYSHEDSVYIFKRLGVMYAANPATREKGRECMKRLLEIEPVARLMESFAGDMLALISANARIEQPVPMTEDRRSETGFEGDPQEHPADAIPVASESKPAPRAKRSPSRVPLYWFGGSVALFAVSVVAYFSLSSSEPERQTFVVDAR